MEWLQLGLAALILLLYICCRRPSGFPPGPWSIPLLGSLIALGQAKGKSVHEKLWSMGKQFGPVCGIFMGPRPAVVINGYEAVKHVLARDDLAFRPSRLQVTSHFFSKRLGVIFTDGPAWKEQRRFTLRHLRDFGFGRRTMEALIHEEARALLDVVGEASHEPVFDVLPLLPVLSINILWTIMAGTRHEFKDTKFVRLTEAVMSFFRSGNALDVVNFYPFLQHVPGINAGFKRQTQAIKDIQTFIEGTIAEHERTYDEGHMRDFIDVYLREMKSPEQEHSSFTSEQLCVMCMDLFLAGTETTSGLLGYCIRYMVQHPMVQSKLRQELLREVGAQRLPTMDDMNKLHYAQAVVTEVLRHSGLVVFTPPHAAAEETDLLGHRVPKGAMVMVNLWSVHMAPEIWGDPEVFRPDRFINQDGTFHKDEHAMFFGFGPRMCLGEPLARYSTLLLFTALLQHFQFLVPPHEAPPSTEQLEGFTTSPAPYVVAVKRVET